MTLSNQFKIVEHPGWGFKFMTVLTLTTGTCFIMWLGEQITERGIGNGMSLIIFAGIVVGFPRAVIDTFQMIQRGELSLLAALLLLAGMFLVVGAIVFVERGQRRIPVQYAKRVVGRRVYGGADDPPAAPRQHRGRHPGHLRLVDHRLPADDRLLLPGQQPLDAERCRSSCAGACRSTTSSTSRSSSSSATSTPRSSSTPTTWRRTCGSTAGFIPGIRPGKRTSEYLDHILGRITFGGAIYLALVAILPEFLITGFKVAPIPVIGPPLDMFLSNNNLGWITEGLHLNFYFGGTSLLIVVGVAMDTIAQVEAQLIMRHYDGFTGRGGKRIRGRR